MNKVVTKWGLQMTTETIETELSWMNTRLVELTKEVQNLAQRISNIGGALSGVRPSEYQHGSLRVITDYRHVFWKDQLIVLTSAEFSMLVCLTRHPEFMKTREQLLDATNDTSRNFNSFDRVVDSRIKRIRAKFKAVDPKFKALRTYYGSGYCWSE